ncbi:hypothetical protein OROGR_030443 [Orobanche gracilis]
MRALRLRYLDKRSSIMACFDQPMLACRSFPPYYQSPKRNLCRISLGARVCIIIGVIYIVSALTGGLLASLFLQDRPSVSASGALFGLIGATFSGFFQSWKVYSGKTAAIVAFLIILMFNAILGLTPLVNNFSNIGGFISGLLVGFMLLFKSHVGKAYQNKGGLFDYDVKNSTKLKQTLDRPVSRIVLSRDSQSPA